jgi:hypothetical protein
MVRAPNQGAGPYLLAGNQRAPAGPQRAAAPHAILDLRLVGGAYLVPAVVAPPPYLRRNLSTRPAVSTIFCLPV